MRCGAVCILDREIQPGGLQGGQDGGIFVLKSRAGFAQVMQPGYEGQPQPGVFLSQPQPDSKLLALAGGERQIPKGQGSLGYIDQVVDEAVYLPAVSFSFGPQQAVG